jgi:hypothetical protein
VQRRARSIRDVSSVDRVRLPGRERLSIGSPRCQLSCPLSCVLRYAGSVGSPDWDAVDV